MSISLVTGFHLTAHDRKIIGLLIAANQQNAENVFSKTPKKKFRILEIKGDQYKIVIWWNETNDWGKKIIGKNTVWVKKSVDILSNTE